MEFWQTIQCPFCGQGFEVNIHPEEGLQFTLDCEICCRPLEVAVTFVDGEVSQLDVRPN